MDVLTVTPYYPPEGGGLERYAHEINHRLAGRGHDVHVATFTREDPGEGKRDGVTVDRRQPAVRIGNAPVSPSFPRELHATVQRRDPDVVVAHTPVPFPAESACLAAWRARVPFVVTYHAGRLHGSSRLLDVLAGLHRRTVEALVLEKSARLIAASPFVREQALADHRDRVTVVPPGVDAERFAPDGGPEGGRILFVGPLSSTYEWKGLDTLWEAFQRVRKRRPEARLTIVGEGDRVAEFQARSSRVDGALEVLGRVSDRALVDAYQRSRVVVLPSTSEAESFGMVLAEANACGRPVVGSKIGGIPDFVDHRDNGLLARPGDPEHLADRLIEVLDDDELAARLGRRGRQRVLADHDWGRLASRTESVLAEALRAGPP